MNPPRARETQFFVRSQCTPLLHTRSRLVYPPHAVGVKRIRGNDKMKYELDLRFTMYKVQFVKLGGYAARGAKPSLAYRPRLERGTQAH